MSKQKPFLHLGVAQFGRARDLGSRGREFEPPHSDQPERGIDMILYHGTPMEFVEPSLERCKPHRDFGCGFYLAPNYFDALPMAIKNSYAGFVHTYELSDTDGLTILELDGYSERWLEIVVKSRLGYPPNVDLVIGNMAGGGSNLQSKFTKLRNSGASVKDVCAMMRKELTNTTLGVQYALLTPSAISKLKLVEIEMIEREDAI